MGKGALSSFPIMFSTFPKANLKFLVTNNLSSANFFNLDNSEIFVGKEYMTVTVTLTFDRKIDRDHLNSDIHVCAKFDEPKSILCLVN